VGIIKLFRLCLLELIQHPRFVLIFMLNSALGLIGLMAVENFRMTFNSVIEARSRQLLGADLSLSTRGKINQEEYEQAIKTLPSDVIESEGVSVMSMAATSNLSRLVSVRSIESNFPFYGGFTFADDSFHPGKKIFLSPNEAWIYRELAILLDVNLDDELKIGNAYYKINGIITNDSLQGFQEGAMAPRVYLSSEGLERADLMGMGSTFRDRKYFQLPESSFQQIDSTIKSWNEIFSDPAINIRGPKESSEQVGQSVNYLNDFLGLVSLVALFLSSIGLFYLFRSYLHGRREDIAILACLGMSGRQRFGLYLIHLLVLGLGSFLLSVIAALILFPILTLLLTNLLPFALPWFAGPRPFVLAFVVGILGNLLLALPLLIPILRLRANAVFQSIEQPETQSLVVNALLFLPWVIFYWTLAVLVAYSWKVGTSFVAVFLGVIAVVFPIGLLVLRAMEMRGRHLKLELKLVLRTLSRFKFATLSLFLALVLGTMLLTMVPTIEHNLRQEIEGPKASRLPSLFLFDIQDEQIEGLQDLFRMKDIELRGLSPMILGRLISINDEPFVRDLDRPRTREEEREHRIRNRGVNLTFRESLDESETIIKGRTFLRAFDPAQDEYAEVTVENRYAKRLGLNIGDKLHFEILDIPFIVKVVGIREVRWTSFMPNFFMVFQPGLLEDAPKTWIAVAPALSGIDKSELQRDIVSTFPNLSIIDVADLIARLMGILEQMKIALSAMAWLSVFVGLFVLYSLVQHQMVTRTKDLNLLKVLGLSFDRLLKMIRYEFLFLSLAASIFGAFISIAVTFIFAHLFFDGLWSFNPWPLLSSIFVVTLLSVLIADFASRRSLKRRAQELLQESH
jgi:putative ABC transport system permease protein